MTGPVRMTVLVTAFEPFDGQPVNASHAAVEVLAARWFAAPATSRVYELVTLQLPVSFRGARQALRSEVAAHRPDVVLCVGEAGNRGVVGLERLAANIIDARIPDNEGSAPVDVPVIAGAPAAFFSTLPLRACAEAVARAGVPVEISATAGTYVCNATFYALMHLLDRAPGPVGGFVHVPRAPEQVAPGAPALATTDVVRALEAILRVVTGDPDEDAGTARAVVTGTES